jgi:8-oxo-dGTP pyrophosphatase MutT (NUDIX family)
MTLPEDRPPPGAPRSRPPRDAATVVVVRDGADGLEVLLLQRAERGDFNSGAWVFPGGLVDPGDGAAQAPGAGLTDEEASRRLSVPSGGLAFYRAAIRECFEEAGLLFANDARGELVSLTDAMAERLSALRGEVQQGTRSFDAACSEFGLRPAPERLHYIAHWLTPVARPKRFDTRFFLAIAPAGQRALHDAQETLDHVWMAPAEALSTRHARRLMNVTRKILELLTPFADTVALAAWAASPRSIERVLPWLALDGGELRPVLPHEPAYAEVRKLDPDGSGDAWCDMRADVAVRLSAHVLRVAARDGGNTYLVGDAHESFVLGPASLEVAHLEAVLAASVGKIRTVLVTDERLRACAERLAALTGAKVEDAASLGDRRELVVDGLQLRVQPVHGALQCLAVADRMAFAPSAAGLAADFRAGADWLAPPEGFLQPLAIRS